MTKAELKAVIMQASQWLGILAGVLGRPFLATAAAALASLAANDAELDLIISGAGTLSAAWLKVLEWLNVTHPEAAMALSAPTTRVG